MRTRSRELEERDLPSEGRETAVDRSLAGEAVRLQELIGNAGATQVLARSPLQRDTAGPETVPTKAGAEEQATAYTLMLDGIGTIDLLSASWGAMGGGGSGGSGSAGHGKKSGLLDLGASKQQDKHTPKIMESIAKGVAIATGELRMAKGGQALAIKLKKGLFTSYQTSEGEPPLEHFSLTFEEHEYDHGEQKAE